MLAPLHALLGLAASAIRAADIEVDGVVDVLLVETTPVVLDGRCAANVFECSFGGCHTG